MFILSFQVDRSVLCMRDFKYELLVRKKNPTSVYKCVFVCVCDNDDNHHHHHLKDPSVNHFLRKKNIIIQVGQYFAKILSSSLYGFKIYPIDANRAVSDLYLFFLASNFSPIAAVAF